MRVLDARNLTIREELTIHCDNPGSRFVRKGAVYLCGEDDSSYALAARFAIAAETLTDKTVAWIGGGLCVGPRLFAVSSCKQTVYEIEQSLDEFCPEGVTFVGGDWRDTFAGKYDVIVFDIGGDVPRETLSRHLNPGGKILPAKD